MHRGILVTTSHQIETRPSIFPLDLIFRRHPRSSDVFKIVQVAIPWDPWMFDSQPGSEPRSLGSAAVRYLEHHQNPRCTVVAMTWLRWNVCCGHSSKLNLHSTGYRWTFQWIKSWKCGWRRACQGYLASPGKHDFVRCYVVQKRHWASHSSLVTLKGRLGTMSESDSMVLCACVRVALFVCCCVSV